ncbi:hypothetical protein JTB14_029185 [Gonioctena quinquepunctata]|nr:hypothetical protein JTB14_029185 [Gonioctena quinquepunctata]
MEDNADDSSVSSDYIDFDCAELDTKLETKRTFSSYYQKIVPGTSSAPKNDGVPKKYSVPENGSIPVNISVPGCSSDLKENTSKFEDISDSEMEDKCSEVAEVPEIISTPMVEKESNISMDYQENLEKEEQSIKNHRMK